MGTICGSCHQATGHAPSCTRSPAAMKSRPGACPECGRIRHPADSTCPRRTKKRTQAGTTKPVRAPVRTASETLVRQTAVIQNGARETARTLLGQLEALRIKLDEKIAAVRELAEIL